MGVVTYECEHVHSKHSNCKNAVLDETQLARGLKGKEPFSGNAIDPAAVLLCGACYQAFEQAKGRIFFPRENVKLG